MARKRQSAQEVADARRRIAARKKKATKPAGLLLRERELTAARRELATRRGTGVATKAQLKRSQDVVKAAERAVERQRAAATRAGRRTS